MNHRGSIAVLQRNKGRFKARSKQTSEVKFAQNSGPLVQSHDPEKPALSFPCCRSCLCTSDSSFSVFNFFLCLLKGTWGVFLARPFLLTCWPRCVWDFSLEYLGQNELVWWRRNSSCFLWPAHLCGRYPVRDCKTPRAVQSSK